MFKHLKQVGMAQLSLRPISPPSHHRRLFGKTDGPGRWLNQQVNQGPLFFNQTNQKPTKPKTNQTKPTKPLFQPNPPKRTPMGPTPPFHSPPGSCAGNCGAFATPAPKAALPAPSAARRCLALELRVLQNFCLTACGWPGGSILY